MHAERVCWISPNSAGSNCCTNRRLSGKLTSVYSWLALRKCLSMKSQLTILFQAIASFHPLTNWTWKVVQLFNFGNLKLLIFFFFFLTVAEVWKMPRRFWQHRGQFVIFAPLVETLVDWWSKLVLGRATAVRIVATDEHRRVLAERQFVVTRIHPR